MNRRTLLSFLAAGLLAAAGPTRADDALLVIAHPSLRGVDADALRRIYTGRMVELDGLPLRPVNLLPGTPVRQRFARGVLQQDDEDVVAYWTVRRYIGKGTPPRELRSAAEVIDFVSRNPGAVGYIDAAEARAGLNVLLKR